MRDYSFVPDYFEFDIDFEGNVFILTEMNDEVMDTISRMVKDWVDKGYIAPSGVDASVIRKEKSFFVEGVVCTLLGEVEDDDEWDPFEVEILF